MHKFKFVFESRLFRFGIEWVREWSKKGKLKGVSPQPSDDQKKENRINIYV